MNKMTIAAAVVAVGLCSAAQAQRADPWGDATVDRAEEAKSAEAQFAALDTDSDGSLTAAEQEAGRGTRGPGGGLRRADADGDGKISKDEYLAAQLRRFDMQDANKDGKLTKAERNAARAQFRPRENPADGAFGGGAFGGSGDD